jgi:hypothetical protein
MGLVVSGVVGATPASAAKPVVNGSGQFACEGSGAKVKVKPPLSVTPAAGTRTWTVKLKLACDDGETTNPAVTATSAKVTGTWTSPASQTCSQVATQYYVGGSASFDVKWKGSGGKVNPTHISYVNYDRGPLASPPPVVGWEVFSFPETNGTEIVTGSYAGSFRIELNTTATMASICSGAPKKGIKKLVVQGSIFD